MPPLPSPGAQRRAADQTTEAIQAMQAAGLDLMDEDNLESTAAQDLTH